MIVTEIGLNHFGSSKIANKFLDYLIQLPIDAVTFQIASDEFYDNQKINFRLSDRFYTSAIRKMHKAKKKIGIAIANCDSFEKYKNSEFDFIKFLSIATKEIGSSYKLKKTKKQIFLSTGMVNNDKLSNILISTSSKNIILLHTSFLKKTENLEKKVIQKLKKKYDLPVGYVHHASSIKSMIDAKKAGCSHIFFYVKRNIKKNHPDEKHAISLNLINNVLKKL